MDIFRIYRRYAIFSLRGSLRGCAGFHSAHVGRLVRQANSPKLESLQYSDSEADNAILASAGIRPGHARGWARHTKVLTLNFERDIQILSGIRVLTAPVETRWLPRE